MSIELTPIALRSVRLLPIELVSIGGVARGELINALFGAGEQGVFYDPSDSATVFQERTGAAATTPAGADDPVGTILDVSGNARHATTFSDARRPIRKTDGAHWWLEFDGVDDVMLFDINIPSSALLCCAGIGYPNGTGTQALELAAATRSNSSLYINKASSSTLSLNFRNSGFSVTGGLGTVASFVNGQSYVFTFTADGSALRHRRDGVQIGASDVGTWPSNPPLVSGSLGNTTESNNAKSMLFTSLVLRAATPSESLTGLVESWIAQKAGITL